MSRFPPPAHRPFDRSPARGIPRDELEDERKHAQHSWTRDLDGLAIEPSPSSSADASVEYGRNQPTQVIHDLTPVASFAARGPPHNAADYDHLLDDEHARDRLRAFDSMDLEDSLGLTGLGVSQSSAGHHVSNATFRAGLGAMLPTSTSTPSRHSEDPTRDLERLRKLQGARPSADTSLEEHRVGRAAAQRADVSISTPRPSRAQVNKRSQLDEPRHGMGVGQRDHDDVYTYHPGTTHGHEGDDSRSLCAVDSPSPFSPKDVSPGSRPTRARLSDALAGSKFSPKGKQPVRLPGNRYSNAVRKQTDQGRVREDEQRDRLNHPQASHSCRTDAVVEEPGSSSQFDALARGLRRDIAAAAGAKESSVIVGSVHLPDMTGLTSAVATPAKVEASYIPYRPSPATSQGLPPSQSGDRRRQGQDRGVALADQHHAGQLQADVHRNTEELTKIQRSFANKQVAARHSAAEDQQEQDFWSGPGISKARQTQQTGRKDGEEARVLPAEANNQELVTTIANLENELARNQAAMRKHEDAIQVMQASHHRHEAALREAQLMKDAHSRQIQETNQELGRLRKDMSHTVGEVARLRHIVQSNLASESRPVQEFEPADSSRGRVDEDEDELLQQPAPSHFMAERRQLSAVTEENEEDLQESEDMRHKDGDREFERPNHIEIQNLDIVPDLSTDSASSHNAPLEFPEPSTPLDDSMHNTSILSMQPMVGSRRKAFVEDEDDISFLKEDVERERSMRGSVQGSPSGIPRPLPSNPQRQQEGESSAPVEPPVRESRPRSRLGNHAADAPRRLDEASSAPKPIIRDERVERLFRTAHHHDGGSCRTCTGQRRRTAIVLQHSAIDVAALAYLVGKGGRPPSSLVNHAVEEEEQRRGPRDLPVPAGEKVPSQEILAQAIQDLEDDFTHYRQVYIELAEQYGLIAPTSRTRRNILAEHLTEVIKVLEKKGDLISTLYDLTA